MASLYRVIKMIYKTVVPKRVRHILYLARPLRTYRDHIIRSLERHAEHDEIYDREYFEATVEPHMASSAEVIAGSILRDLSPSSAVELGCGTGLLLLALQREGVSCLGLDYAEAALEICRNRGLSVRKCDLESDVSFELSADIAISMEVAEHLPASCADRFVNLLCRIAPVVVLTAAEPGTAGENHVNLQPTSYWIEQFESRGHVFDSYISLKWRQEWNLKAVAGCYASTVMVFRQAHP